MLIVQEIVQARYRLIERLGQNGPRQTWLATDERTGKQAVLKVLFFGQDMQWQDLKLIEREAATLQSLDHPRIPRFIEAFWLEGAEGSSFCLVQDYLPGLSLADLMRQGRRWSQSEVRALGQSLLEILTYLHGLSPPVIHRDIKPGNIILSEDGGVYLIDFGAVQAQVNTAMTMTVVGTFSYMAPEQFYGQAGPASDLYGLGATLLELVSGKDPTQWTREGAQVCLGAWAQTDSVFEHWLERLLEPKLTERFQTAQEALSALRSGTAQMLSPTAPPAVSSPPGVTRSATNTPQANWLVPLEMPKRTTEQVQTVKGSLEVHSDPHVLQVVVPIQVARKLGPVLGLSIVPAVFSAIAVAPIYLITSVFGLMNDGGAVLSMIWLILIFLIVIATLSVVITSETHLIMDRTRFYLKSQYGVKGGPLESFLRVNWTQEPDMLDYTLWLELSDGACEKIDVGFTEAECRWIAQCIDEWRSTHR